MPTTEPTEEVMVELKRKFIPNDGLGENHPLASAFGVFADDPLWEEFQQAIARAHRREMAGQCAFCGQPLPVEDVLPLVRHSGDED